MGAIPTSDMPGYQPLHQRVQFALDKCQESQAVDFKESARWDQLKWTITRSVMAMTNLRDGGIIVIGVSERNGRWELPGITAADLNTYDVDDLIDFVNKYASPPLSLEIVRIMHRNELEFLAIQVREFEETPCVCRRNGSTEQSETFRQGDIYIRPPGKPQTRRVTTAEEMHDLLELAAEKRARRMIETSHRIGFMPAPHASSLFDQEVQGL
jgi:predicted HTH transcriptional regulator